jgi:hypothetical protein
MAACLVPLSVSWTAKLLFFWVKWMQDGFKQKPFVGVECSKKPIIVHDIFILLKNRCDI